MNAGQAAQQQQMNWADKLREDLFATYKFWRSRRTRRRTPRLDDALWKRWATAVSHVEEDVQSTAHDRDVFQQFSAMVRENESWIAEHEGLFFCRFIANAYVAKVASGVRRHVKRGDDSNSLLRILSDLRERAPQLTFEFFLRQFPHDPEYVPWQESTFAFVSKDGRVASETLIGEHIDTFKKLTAQIEGYVDRTVAHLDPKGFKGSVTFDDLDKAIVALDDLAIKYICLFTGRGYPSSLAPTIQFNWKRIFDVPWRKPSGLII